MNTYQAQLEIKSTHNGQLLRAVDIGLCGSIKSLRAITSLAAQAAWLAGYDVPVAELRGRHWESGRFIDPSVLSSGVREYSDGGGNTLAIEIIKIKKG